MEQDMEKAGQRRSCDKCWYVSASLGSAIRMMPSCRRSRLVMVRMMIIEYYDEDTEKAAYIQPQPTYSESLLLSSALEP